jgi:hypothetical protein
LALVADRIKGAAGFSISGETRMFSVRRLLAMAVVLFGLGILLPVRAHAIELTGAWASQADLCKLVFTKKGNGIVFAELSDLYGSGFIIEGNRIRGKAARCTITSRKQDGDALELAASCATSIMNQSVRFSLKIIDDNNLSRLFPEIPGMTLKYTRCAL